MASNLHEESTADELAQTTWRDDAWLSFFPLNIFTALDYFALSPFYDRNCNNELAKSQGGDVKLAWVPLVLLLYMHVLGLMANAGATFDSVYNSEIGHLS